MKLKNLFKTFIIISFILGSSLFTASHSLVNAQNCFPTEACTANQTSCGVGMCTTWLFCVAPTGPCTGRAERGSCFAPTMCPDGIARCGGCPGGPGPVPPTCGDNQCNGAESCSSCSADCGSCTTYISQCNWDSNNPVNCVPDATNCGNYLPYDQYGYGICSASNPPNRPCCNGLTNNGGTCGCPVCTTAAPTAPTLNTPADNSTVTTNNVPLSWNQNGSWGTGCPQNNNQYRVYISQACTGNYVNYSTVPGTITSLTLNGLTYGETYCWYVQKTNESQFANSTVRRFTINTPPSVGTGGFQADACGYSATGRTDSVSLTKSNPMTYLTNFIDAESDPFQHIVIAFVPQGLVNTATADSVQVLNAVLSSQSVAAILYPTSVAVLTTGRIWSPTGSSDQTITNTTGTASILNAGTNSKMATSGNTAQGNVTIRFENTYPSGMQNIYIMAVTRLSDGTLVSSDQGSSGIQMMRRMGSWLFDMINPNVSINTSNYVGNTFATQWSGTDSSGLRNAYSYIWANGTGAVLVDTTTGNIINPMTTTELDYPAASNAGITMVNLPATRNYAYSGTQTSFNLRLAVEDKACNIFKFTGGATPPFPWLVARDGIISANGGISNITIPNVTNINIPDFDNPTLLVNSTSVNLTTNSATSGTSSLPIPANSISTRNTYTYNYNNQASSPDLRTGQTTWYNYVLNTLQKNGDAEIITVSSAGNVDINNTNTSTYLDALKGSASDSNKVYAVHITNGNLRFFGSTCDRNVIFISPNQISLNPDIRKTTTGGCVFVSGEGIGTSTGPIKTSVLLATGGDSKYDIMEAYLITDGTFTVPTDSASGATWQWDGLVLKGGVVARNVSLSRSLNASGNADQPGLVFQYDPYYSVNLKDAFAQRFYTIREFIP